MCEQNKHDLEHKALRRQRVEKAIEAIQNGGMVLLTDAVDRENEADFIASANTVTAKQLNVMRKDGSGIICVALNQDSARKLQLPLMVDCVQNKNLQGTAFTVSVEARVGITTGVSIADRLKTIRLFATAQVEANDFVRPGHVFPLIAHQNGLAGRQGHTEGSLALLELANDASPAVICEAVDNEGQSLSGKALEVYAKQNNYLLVSNEDLLWYQNTIKNKCVDFVETKLPTEFGDFYMRVYKDDQQQDVTVLSTMPFMQLNKHQPLTIRLHSSCLTGDIFGSMRCDCKEQLHQSLKMIQDKGGLLLYLNQEGRGIGLFNKIKAYALQDGGCDTVEANIALGFPADQRDYSFACALIKSLGISSVNVITNNPCKANACEQAGLKIAKQITFESSQNIYNENYLLTKVNKMNHAEKLISS